MRALGHHDPPTRLAALDLLARLPPAQARDELVELRATARAAHACRELEEAPLLADAKRCRELNASLAAALASSVQLHLLPKSIISVHVLVLQDDGGVLPAAVSCASLALADASLSPLPCATLSRAPTTLSKRPSIRDDPPPTTAVDVRVFVVDDVVVAALPPSSPNFAS